MISFAIDENFSPSWAPASLSLAFEPRQWKEGASVLAGATVEVTYSSITWRLISHK